jgi:hypothetical protein
MGVPGGSGWGNGKGDAGAVSSLLVDLAASGQGLGDREQESVGGVLLVMLGALAQRPREQ